MQSKTLKQIKNLQQKKYRYEFREFFVEGIKSVKEALAFPNVLSIVIEGSRRDEKEFAEIIKTAEKKNVPVEFCGRREVEYLKTTESFPGIMAIIEMPEVVFEDLMDERPIICLDEIKDPGNLGTIIRTADWFGIHNIILSEDSVDPYNEKTVRSTMGSIFRVKILNKYKLSAVLEKIKKEDYKIFAFKANSENEWDGKIPPKSVLIFGSESHGIRAEYVDFADKLYSIKGKGSAESLNLAVSVGIVLSKL
jgi:TrmH family RNA methyltransferase